MSGRRITLMFCVFLLGLAGSTPAELLVYDGFDYPEGPLGANAGGTGWDGGVAWDGSQTVTSPGLEYPGLPAIGNKVATGGTYSFRMMPAGFDATNKTIWIGFLCEDSATPSWSGISPFDGGSEALFIGKPDTAANWGIVLYNAQGDAAATGERGSDIAVSERVFFVVRIINGTASAQITAWVNPDVSSEPTVDTAFYDSQATGEVAGRVLFDRIRIAGADALFYDELRVGEVYYDVSACNPGFASAPSPQEDQGDVPQGAMLSWTPGEFAATHNVYLGANFEDVNDATVANPLDVLVGEGQGTNTFDPDPLMLGTTYYWRVDEVNAPPTSDTVFKGKVWSFTVEPLYYTVADVNVTTSAPTADGSGEPEVMVNESGLTDGQHAVGDLTMWSGKTPVGEPIWLQFDFDRVYKLFGIHIWNYNGLYEFLLGFGLKDITIEYATEPNEWVTLGDYQLARGTNQPTYTGERIDLEGLPARSIRISVNNIHYGGPQPGLDNEVQAGLSEIQFFYKPVMARAPQPADGAAEVDRAASLRWRPGREATGHQVYLGTDSNAVADGIALADTVFSSPYDPGALLLGTTYYWKIGEVNEAETPTVWDSPVWSFTTQEYVTIDGFESYTDDEGNRIYQTWLDGYDSNDNGSQVGHDDPPYAEEAIRHSGAQSMPLYYRNTNGKAHSEAELTFSPAQDLTANGADTLSLYYRGDPTGFVQMAEGDIVMNGTGSDIWGTSDQFRFVYKQLTGNGSIIARVDHLDNSNEWAKVGVMIRETLESDSVLVDGIVTPTGRVGMQWRTARAVDMGNPDMSSHSVVDAITLPLWLKLTRNNDVFTVQHSDDGVNWVDIVPETIDDPISVTQAMPETVYIGLAVTSHATDQVAGAHFTGIATTGNVAGQWQSISIGVDQPAGNQLDQFYLDVEDSSGTIATIAHPSAVAVGLGTWMQWPIALSDIMAAGVDVTSVTKLRIGVGDKTQPSTGASGILYIDDVAFGHPIDTE